MMNQSRVVIGTWAFGSAYGNFNKEKAKRILQYCYEKGFREFDTAAAYGNGSVEKLLGELFSEKKVLINTKFGARPFKEKSFEIQNLRECFEQSLKRLSRDSVNILFLHNPRDEIKNWDSILELFDKLKQENKIKSSGISIARRYDYSRKIDLNKFDVIQNDANLLCMDFLKMNFKGLFMARSPMASGILYGKLTKSSIFPAGDHRTKWLQGERLKSILKRIDMLKKIAKEKNIELSSLARRFVLSNNKINKVIFGIKEKEHVDSLLKELNNPEINKETEKQLIKLYKKDFGLENERYLAY